MLRLVVEFPRQGQLFCSDATHRVFRIGVTGILWKYFVHFNYDEPTEPNPLLSPLGRSGPRATLHMFPVHGAAGELPPAQNTWFSVIFLGLSAEFTDSRCFSCKG